MLKIISYIIVIVILFVFANFKYKFDSKERKKRFYVVTGALCIVLGIVSIKLECFILQFITLYILGVSIYGIIKSMIKK